MVAIPRKEIGLSSQANHQIHAQRLIKGHAALQVPYIEVHMAETQSLRKAIEWLSLAQQRGSIEPDGVHDQLAIAELPGLARPIGIYFDAVAFGVAQVEGLAHQVIGSTSKRDALIDAVL